MTLNKAMIDFGKTESTPGEAYVALARVRSLEKVLIEYGFDSDRIMKISEPDYVAEFEKETQVLINKTKIQCDKVLDNSNNNSDDSNNDINNQQKYQQS